MNHSPMCAIGTLWISETAVFRTPGGAAVGVVVRLWLAVWLWRVGRQSGGSEDVLTGPAFGGCIHVIVCLN